MRRHRLALTSAVLAGALLAVSLPSIRGEDVKHDWLRGSGADLQLRFAGEVFSADGMPAIEFTVSGEYNATGGPFPFEAEVKGNRFETWMPVNRMRLYSMWVRVASANDDEVAYLKLSAEHLRQTAIDGIKVTLAAPSRDVSVQVMEQRKPVAEAWVQAELGYGIKLRTRADRHGIARLRLLPDQELKHLMAWADDCRIGGYGFDRKPFRDPSAASHIVELSRCRDQKLRFVDEDGKPVAGIEVQLQIATSSPAWNYIGMNELLRLTTDSAGVAVCRWFPDWSEHHFYTELLTNQWVIADDKRQVGDEFVFTLKRSRITERKTVEGRIEANGTHPAGFFVRMRSHQGEQKGRSDIVSAFAGVDGIFSCDVLPDATYCAFAMDRQWAGETIDLIPYESETDTIAEPVLSVSAGEEVEVIVTTGPKRRPYSDLLIHLSRPHVFSYQQEGETRSGQSGPQWYVKTDESGRAVARALPGELEASVYSPQWRTQQKVNVVSGQPATIRLHREVDQKRTVRGKLVLEGLDVDPASIELRVGAVDGSYDDEQSLTPNADGSFSFETLAAEVGVFASTPDGTLAGSMTTIDFEKPLELVLLPTQDIQRQLLDSNDQPLAGYKIRAYARVPSSNPSRGMTPFARSFPARRIDAVTKDDGYYTLSGIPLELPVTIQAVDPETSEETVLEEVYLTTDEVGPRLINRLNRDVPRRNGKQPKPAK